MFHVPVEAGIVRQAVDDAVHAGAHESLFLQVLEQVEVLSLPVSDHRREDVHARALGKGENPVDDLVAGLSGDGFRAGEAVNGAEPGVEYALVVVDLGHRADGAARITTGGFLLDGYRGRQAGDVVDVRLLHLVHELPGIGRQRLDVPALTLGVDRVERHRAFARTGNAGEHDKPVLRDRQAHVLEVVNARAAHDDLVAVHRSSVFAHARRLRRPEPPLLKHNTGSLRRTQGAVYVVLCPFRWPMYAKRSGRRRYWNAGSCPVLATRSGQEYNNNAPAE